MTGAEYLAFVGASLVLAVTPGPDTFLTLRFGARGFRAGVVYTLAVTVGIVAWAVLTLTGVAVLLETYPGLRVGITLVGGSYLVYLGVAALLPVIRRHRARRLQRAPRAAALVTAGGPAPATGEHDVGHLPAAPGDPVAPGVPTPGVRSGRSVFGTGLVSSLTNPKTGLFFLALLPPFLPASPDLLDRGLLVATVAAAIFVYGVLLSAVADRAGQFLTGGSGPDLVDLVSGTILVLLGLTIILL